MCMTPVELRRVNAAISMWSIRNYYHDLGEYFGGDEARFNRMVVDGGKSLPSAHPHGWAQHIVSRTTAEAVEFYRDELRTIYAQLAEWRLITEIPEALQ